MHHLNCLQFSFYFFKIETTGHRSRDQDKCQISPSHNKSYVSTAEIDRKVEGYMEEHIPGLENLSIDCQVRESEIIIIS